ncbi:hypothetical protein [Clostridium folliculivorans]|uniref:hypothetical protein n=1 Tax=Clostridium folliculivorans TaxID=2886038 RepID=UPI0021C261C6|nr:hypothetical protein [Clostridium folliculivorans]GKU29334.1 hypothetical protein CFB3_14400 [Clostridium folliculivorans]
MSKVINLKSRKHLGRNDYKETDELASKKGKYIGALPLKVATELRELQDILIIEQIKINQLVDEFDEHFAQYIHEINAILGKNNHVIKSYNYETENLLIGEDGHMWIVKNSDLNVK